MKKTGIAAIVMLTLASAITASGESGRLTTTITWDLTDSVLTISGTGAMPSYAPARLNANPFADERFALKVKTIVIGEGITKIGNHSFGSRNDEKNARVMREDASRGYNPMQSNDAGRGSALYANLRNVYLPSTLRKIGSMAFTRIPVENIVIPDGVNEIGYAAFATSGLRSVKMPASLKRLGAEAFNSCANLVAVDFNGCPLKMITGQFFNCESLRIILHPQNIREVNETVFDATLFRTFTPDELLAMFKTDGPENYLARNMPMRESFNGDDKAYEDCKARVLDQFYRNEAINASKVFRLDSFSLGPYQSEAQNCVIETRCHGRFLLPVSAEQYSALNNAWQQIIDNASPTFVPRNGSLQIQSATFALPDGSNIIAAKMSEE